MSVGQDIQGTVMFPEDTYETGQYQEDGPKPEDKVYNTAVLVEILFIETPLVIFRQFKTLNSNNFTPSSMFSFQNTWPTKRKALYTYIFIHFCVRIRLDNNLCIFKTFM